MTVSEKTERGTDSIRTDQIGKVFIALSQDMRECLICDGVFTRRGASEHAKVVCMPGYRHETGKVRLADYTPGAKSPTAVSFVVNTPSRSPHAGRPVHR